MKKIMIVAAVIAATIDSANATQMMRGIEGQLKPLKEVKGYLDIGRDPYGFRTLSEGEKLYILDQEVEVYCEGSHAIYHGFLPAGTRVVVRSADNRVLRIYRCGNPVLNPIYVRIEEPTFKGREVPPTPPTPAAPVPPRPRVGFEGVGSLRIEGYEGISSVGAGLAAGLRGSYRVGGLRPFGEMGLELWQRGEEDSRNPISPYYSAGVQLFAERECRPFISWIRRASPSYDFWGGGVRWEVPETPFPISVELGIWWTPTPQKKEKPSLGVETH